MNTHQLTKLILQRSGLSDEMVMKGKSDMQFDAILQALSDVHKGKEVLYGSYLETHGEDPKIFSLVTHYADIKRKFVRVENIIKAMSKDKDISIDELLDTYADMAVYAVMGIQLINHHKEVEEKQNATTQQSN